MKLYKCKSKQYFVGFAHFAFKTILIIWQTGPSEFFCYILTKLFRPGCLDCSSRLLRGKNRRLLWEMADSGHNTPPSQSTILSSSFLPPTRWPAPSTVMLVLVHVLRLEAMYKNNLSTINRLCTQGFNIQFQYTIPFITVSDDVGAVTI